ncbi:amino acid ABC transporter substrate-binding protein [Azospirillum rugosum]|uniref:General L-amino acid transport system substrate-binding protein n=1 Tax=Azospirillum rugosum TaxID=416170 RepID=A0ABS4SFF6_9PROT|nr:amino acid ABC transporter substrate-binding protein [Azospirillum rugosum]MBP2291299.1 general L-amino acid transport system substrate-binding protein [Azospirillum rugosum]MDQ0525087.1 general L-amino acid transport system substrate-binding protein [Azospirillum rugosum]
MKIRLAVASAAMSVALATGASSVAQAGVLDTVKQRGNVVCGVSGKVPGFSVPDAQGVWSGMDVDYCRAIAAAVFNDASKVTFRPVTTTERFTALQTGEIDVLARNTTWSFTRDANLGIEFVGANFYDGQGFMVSKQLGVKSAKELNGASICIQTGTTAEQNIADFFTANKLTFKQVVFESSDEAAKLYDTGRCDVYTTDTSGLAARRTTLSKPADHVILPEVISKEPLGPSVRAGDPQWANIAKWALFAQINAEELGVTQANVDEMRQSKNPDVRRLLGSDEALGNERWGLDRDWAYRIVKLVGNYGEVFERNVGTKTSLGLDRGINQLWTKGGLMYAPPVR